MKKNYTSTTFRRFASLALALIASYVGLSQASYTLNYTGSVQTVTLQPGVYSVTCWGGNGGDGTYYSSQNPNNNISGGRGGFATGGFTVNSTTVYYVYVGGRGTNLLSSNNPGGFNGGGNSSTAPYQAGSGGGASHIATASGVLSSLASNTAAIRIVAGGGGGGGNQSLGGDGGGLTGIQPPNSTQFSNRTAGGGGSQTFAGSCYSGGSGAGFGQGGVTTQNLAGGGGGGWYGGCTGENSTAGGGGSSYIGGVSNGTTAAFGTSSFVANPVTTGHGLVLIKEICIFNLIPSTTNTVNPAICAGQSLTLTTNAVSNFAWSNGANTASTVVTPSTNTIYSITATSAAGCTGTQTLSVLVSGAQPSLAVVSSTNQTCLGKTTTLTATGALTYTWSNNVSNGVAFTPSVTNTYTVFGQNGCGTTSAVTTISVAPLAVGILANTNTVCLGSAATCTVVSAATMYSWAPTNFSTTQSSYNVSPSVPTVYTVSVSDGTCTGSGTIAIGVNPVPTIALAVSNATPCMGAVISATASGGNNYTWTPINTTGQTATLAPMSPTLLTVSGDNQFGCTAFAQQIILVKPAPTVGSAFTSTTICNGTSAVLNAVGTAGSYTWSGQAAGISATVNPTSTTVYSVVGEHTNGCTAQATATVDVITVTVAVTGPTAVCVGGSATLTASGADNYQWVGGAPFSQNIVSPTVNTTYSVICTTNTVGLMCVSEATYQVQMIPNPTVTASGTRSVMCRNETQTLTASGASTYSWSNGTSGSFVVFAPKTATVQTFTVTGTSTDNCKSKGVLTITVQACLGLNDIAGELINVYPNPSNGVFNIDGVEQATVKVFNQTGQLVYQGEVTKENNTIDLTGFAKGIYQVTLVKGNTTTVKKIVLE